WIRGEEIENSQTVKNLQQITLHKESHKSTEDHSKYAFSTSNLEYVRYSLYCFSIGSIFKKRKREKSKKRTHCGSTQRRLARQYSSLGGQNESESMQQASQRSRRAS
ncbi:MAG: hypothetical protein WCO92_03490, partial [Verrucomicrobiota bacterium]